jgi:serine phosphatase RsbU (regulator of sigma subunit)/CHASE3 domain sensor protein
VVRLSLRWKIVGGFGLLLALIALLGWVTLSLFESLRGVQRKVFDNAIPGLVAVDEIARSYTAQSAAVRGAVIGSARTLLDRYELEVATTDFWERRGMELFDSAHERDLLNRLVQAGEDFHRLVDEEVIPRATEGERSQAFLILDGEGARLISEIEIQSELLHQEQEKSVVETEREVRNNTRNSIILLLVVLIGALALGLLLAIILPRRLSRNLSRLVEAARAIGRGDFEQSLEIRSGDEVEELSVRFTEMQAGLKRLQQLALQDRELEIAASIQRNLLQRSIPAPPHVRITPVQRQANLVGGDWYDVDVSSDELTIVVGDASGKGIAAALMATVALAFLRAERGLGSDRKRIIQRTNEALLDATDPGSFTTVIYASLNLGNGEIRWLNMGHPAPFLIRSEARDGAGPGHYLEGPRNRALGWFEHPGLAETVAHLGPGDCLIFFTDGWLEAKASDGDVFGEQRFAEAIARLAPLGASALAEQLVGEVERFAAGKLEDDLTMLIVEFEGASMPQQPVGRRTGEESWHSRR